ncbi:YxeA family protein [Vallitalea guaymasensis]|uniref:YxeA family protein n=1 Tax=Vallitalea guaymasensis TaxID=1185412 RepID=UPI002356AB61|nr:YxeA family protein [Vallitalea guaymasensis]
MKKKILGLIVLIVLIIFAFVHLFLNPRQLIPEDPEGKAIYYTQVNSNQVKKNDDERYEYSLPSYNKKGKEKILSFTASKKLREEAYLELYETPLRGVTYWQELKYKDLPEAVQKIYIDQ